LFRLDHGNKKLGLCRKCGAWGSCAWEGTHKGNIMRQPSNNRHVVCFAQRRDVQNDRQVFCYSDLKTKLLTVWLRICMAIQMLRCSNAQILRCKWLCIYFSIITIITPM
jgi:hypothetical protein